jgi:hypothetical protein
MRRAAARVAVRRLTVEGRCLKDDVRAVQEVVVATQLWVLQQMLRGVAPLWAAVATASLRAGVRTERQP